MLNAIDLFVNIPNKPINNLLPQSLQSMEDCIFGSAPFLNASLRIQLKSVVPLRNWYVTVRHMQQIITLYTRG